MRRFRWMIGALLIGALILPACKTIEETSTKNDPAKVEAIGETGLSRVTLTAKAVERLGLATAAVERTGARLTIPYAAVIYDHSAKTWTYTNPAPQVYVRAPVTIESIVGNVAVLSSGPAVGTRIVTTGSALLFGAELGVGK